MSIVVQLNKRSGQGSPLSTSQVDENWDAIEAGFLQAGDGSGDGTVSSVGFSAPAIFAVANAPVTTTGTITLTLTTQTANRVWAGPTTGSAATPTFRVLVGDDLPTVPVAKGGTGNTGFVSSRVIVSTASNVIGVSAVTTTELGYLSGVTGDIQAQINGKQNTITVLPIVNGGTGASTAQGARLAILPAIAASAAKFLRVNAGATDVEYATLLVGTSGSDVAWSTSGSNTTLNVPSASGSARGVVTTTAQTFAGEKTFTDAPKLTASTARTVQWLNSTNVLVGQVGFDYGANTTGELRVPSVAKTNQTRLTATTVLDETYNYIRSEQAAAATYTLPAADITLIGHEYFVKDSLGNAATRNIILRPDGSDKLDNVAGGTKTIGTAYGYIGVVCVDLGSSTYGWEVIVASGVS
jgi:hypothetical protein